jgi:anti-sigma B factor antagonist
MTDEILEVLTTERQGVPVVWAAGEVDVSTAPRLREHLTTLPVDARRVVVDLSEVTFLDSTGLGVLVAGWKRCQESGASLELVVTRPQVRKVLEITSLDGVFTIFDSIDEAFPDSPDSPDRDDAPPAPVAADRGITP